MIADFEYTITIGDEDVDVCVEYRAIRGEDDVELISVTLDGEEIVLTPEQERDIISACFDRIDDDFEEDRASYGDYRYEMSRYDD